MPLTNYIFLLCKSVAGFEMWKILYGTFTGYEGNCIVKTIEGDSENVCDLCGSICRSGAGIVVGEIRCVVIIRFDWCAFWVFKLRKTGC